MFITNYNLVNYTNGIYTYALLSGLLLGVSSARHQDFFPVPLHHSDCVGAGVYFVFVIV
jgi:hypothetical protein